MKKLFSALSIPAILPALGLGLGLLYPLSPYAEFDPILSIDRLKRSEAQLLARVPARYYGSVYTIKVDLPIGSGSLTGQFLVDPSSARTQVSEQWLRLQGWTREKIPFRSPGILAAEHLEIGGYRFPIQGLQVKETLEIFDDTRWPKACCDGILGAEIFEKHVIEWKREPTASILVWTNAELKNPPLEWHRLVVSGRKNSSTSAPLSWQVLCESAELSSGESSREKPIQKGKKASPEVLEVSFRSESNFTPTFPKNCGLELSGVPLPKSSERLHADESKPTRAHSALVGRAAQRYQMGMSAFSALQWVIDRPRSRIATRGWIDPRLKRQELQDLEVEFRQVRKKWDERRLFVRSIRKSDFSQDMINRGLARDLELIQINGIATQGMSIREVQDHLSGRKSDEVLIQWRAPSGKLKLGKLQYALTP